MGKTFLLLILAVLVWGPEIGPSASAHPVSCLRTAAADSTISQTISLISDSAIYSDISEMQSFLTRRWDRTNRENVFQWLMSKFEEAGISDVQTDTFRVNGILEKNIVATIPGKLIPQSVIIVGGHFDSYNSRWPDQAPGADDNASGTAAAIEMARVLEAVNYEPSATLKFIGFAAEEAGLRGSENYAQGAYYAGMDIKLMMNYDMIGYRNLLESDRNFYVITYPGSEACSDLYAEMASDYTSLTPVFTDLYMGQSDSWSFYEMGYKTLFAMEEDFNPYYHSANDLIDSLDIHYAGEIVKAGLATLLVLDQVPPLISGLNILDRGTGNALLARPQNVPLPDFSSYRVYIGRQAGNYDSSFLSASGDIEINGLAAGTRYHIGVSMVDMLGLESEIVEKSAVPLNVPLPPSGLTVSSTTSGPMLQWVPNREMDIKGYNVYRKAAREMSYGLLKFVLHPDTVFTDSTKPRDSWSYFVTALDSSGNGSTPSDTLEFIPASVLGINETHPLGFMLEQNYPNPFNPSTVIRYALPGRTVTSLRIYNMLGQEVAAFADEVKNAGSYEVSWNAGGLPGGIYICCLKTLYGRMVRSMLLLR